MPEKDLSLSDNVETTQYLPNLLNRNLEHSHDIRRSSEQRDSKLNYSTLQSKGLDILFLKRLMYLKSLIDDNRNIQKERRELSKERLENNNLIDYSNTLSTAMLSLKPAEQKDSLMAENTIFTQVQDLSKINSSNSPVRVSLGEKIGNRREKFRQTHSKIFNQVQNKSSKIAAANNTFFVTQTSIDKKSKLNLNKSNLEDSVSNSYRKLYKNLTNTSEIPLSSDATRGIEASSKIAENKFMTEKDISDINELELNNKLKTKGRNNVENYWKFNPTYIGHKNFAMYKSFDNIKADKAVSVSELTPNPLPQ